jgi:hypothetical protein
VNGESGRPRLSPALLVSGLVLGLDAIACQLLALVLALPMWISLWPGLTTADLGAAAALGTASLLALWCPAAAALVLGVRGRAARLTGLATAAVLAVGAAALAADGLGTGVTGGQFVAGLVALAANLGVVALLVTPGPPVTPGADPAEPARMIDLDA